MGRLTPRAVRRRARPARDAVARLTLLALAAACGGPTDPGELPSPSEACVDRPLTQLAVGDHAVLDPAASSGCLRLPVAAATGAQYLLVVASTNGTKSPTGISGSYLLRASHPTVVVAAPEPAAPVTAPSRPERFAGAAAAAFDATLRREERRLAAAALPLSRLSPPAGPRLAPPLGDVKTFKTCANLQCTSVGTVTATARYVGAHVAIYVDDEVPQNDPLRDSDLTNLGQAFDNHHYPIDTTAFGRESDIDANGLVLMLMTDAVNALTPDCKDGRVIGYFFGGDLLTASPNSNRAEIFYTLVPAPATPDCSAVTRSQAVNALKPTLIHELQHMISFNQHVLLRGGLSEDVWLNEALSHFAEELGGRLVPDAECTAAGFSSCRSQYAGGDIQDAWDYLKDSEAHYMVFPSSSQGTLPERGAAWLFLRWSLDQFSPDTILGTPTTRALVGTSLTGVANLQGATGGSFAFMVPQWLLAAYLDDGPDLPVEPSGRLRFKSWGLRAIWTDPRNSGIFPGGFPLAPKSIAGTFSHSGTLRAGSGRHFLIFQAGSGAAIDLQVLKDASGGPLDPNLQTRFGIVRIR